MLLRQRWACSVCEFSDSIIPHKKNDPCHIILRQCGTFGASSQTSFMTVDSLNDNVSKFNLLHSDDHPHLCCRPPSVYSVSVLPEVIALRNIPCWWLFADALKLKMLVYLETPQKAVIVWLQLCCTNRQISGLPRLFEKTIFPGWLSFHVVSLKPQLIARVITGSTWLGTETLQD